MNDLIAQGGFEPQRSHRWSLRDDAPDLVDLSLVSLQMEPGTCTLTLRLWCDNENPVVLFADHLFARDSFVVTLFSSGEQEQVKKLRIKFENTAVIPVAALDMQTSDNVFGKLVFTGVKYEVIEWNA